MADFIMAQENGRTIPKEDMIYSIGGRANDAVAKYGKDAVINATIGTLLDDNEDVLVLSSVQDTFKKLSANDFAAYAPIGGLLGFKKAVIKAALKNFTTKREVRAVAAAGGTGAIRLAVSNYSKYGDKILTTDWHWGPYGKIAGELGREVVNFELFDENNNFNAKDFEKHVTELAEKQDSLMIILNTPAQNPTGYSLCVDEWKEVKAVLEALPKTKKITVLCDTAYIDFAGDEDQVRNFLPIIDTFADNILPLLAYSLSKTFTIYGMRTGALICMAPTAEIAEEFVMVAEFSARASWSNCSRSGQALIERIYADEELLAKVTAERAEIRDMLLQRAKAFEDAASEEGVPMLPYCGGFFAVVPYKDAKALGLELEKENIFAIPFGAGLRISLASVPEAKCSLIPKAIKEAMAKLK